MALELSLSLSLSVKPSSDLALYLSRTGRHWDEDSSIKSGCFGPPSHFSTSLFSIGPGYDLGGFLLPFVSWVLETRSGGAGAGSGGGSLLFFVLGSWVNAN